MLCVHLRTFGTISATEKKSNKNSASINNDETIVMLVPDNNYSPHSSDRLAKKKEQISSKELQENLLGDENREEANVNTS